MEDIYTILTRLENELLPAALELASGIVFWDSFGALVIGIVAAIVFGLAAPRGVRSARLSIEITKARDERYRNDEEFDNLLWAIGYGLVSAFTLITALVNLLNIWNWVGVFNPKLAFAKIIFDRIMQ